MLFFPTLSVQASIFRRLVSYAIAVAALVPLQLRAQVPSDSSCGANPGGAPCGGGGVANGASSTGVPVGAGNPLNVMTGNKHQREVDMPALPGEMGLELVRYYNSERSGINAPAGLVGRGWKLSYETTLYAISSSLQIVQADGNRLIFNRDHRNRALCSTSNPANGTVEIRQKRSGEEYVWLIPDGRRMYFNSGGKLMQIRAPSGAFVSMQYDAQGLLVKVTDPQQRALNLSYLAQEIGRDGARFKGVQAIDSPAGRFSYEYGGSLPKGTLADPKASLANLVRVRLPTRYDADTKPHPRANRGTTVSNLSRIYHYEDARFPTLLTGISNASDAPANNARFATFGYDTHGRANLSTHAGNVGKITLDTGVRGKTLLTNSLGQTTEYTHTVIAGEHRLLAVRGAGCSSCGEKNVRYGYDSVGRLTETTSLGEDGTPIVTTRTELDELGRAVRIERGAYAKGKLQPLTLLARFEYKENQTAPVLIARPSVVPGEEVTMRIDYNEANQPLKVTEMGWAPAIDEARAATRIERTTSYSYARINGHSVLTQIDGPLPNGKTGSPLDSDVTVIEYDNQGRPADGPKGGDKPGLLDAYDRRFGIVSAIVTPGNFKSEVAYDAAGRISAVSSLDGRTTSLRYAPRGQLLSITQDGVTHTTTYDSLDYPVETGYTVDGVYRGSVRSGYDEAGRNVWSASSLGVVTYYRYDTESHLLESSTRSGTIAQTRTYLYDQLGRLHTTTDPRGGMRRIAWNAQGLPNVLYDALGRATLFRYDAMGNITGVTEAANSQQAQLHNTETNFELDAHGGVTAVTAPNGATTRHVIDDLGRHIATFGADSGKTMRSFDVAGRLVASTDANGNRAAYEYDVAGRIVRQTMTDVTSADPARRQVVTTWRYEGPRLAAVDHPEQGERYQYDEQGRVSVRIVSIVLQNGARATYETRYRYDSLGEMSSVSLPDGSTLDYRRNGQNQITALERNPLRSSWLRWLLPAQSIVKNLERDAVGLKRLTYGNDIEALYQRSKEGSLARIVYRDPRAPAPAEWRGAALATLLSPAFAAPAPVNLPAKQAMLPGALGLPPDPNALLDHRYLWDVQGNLLHAKGKDGESSFAYDAQDHLIVAASSLPGSDTPNKIARYHYDGNGNRLLVQEGIADQSDIASNTIRMSYRPASDRLHPEPGYDANGQIVRAGDRRFKWNPLGQLLEVRDGTRVVASYRYNHRGERIGKNAGNQQTHFLYEERRLVAELDGEGRIKRQYVYLAGQPVAIIDAVAGKKLDRGEQTRWSRFVGDVAIIWQAWFGGKEMLAYLHANHLGAIELVTDQASKPIWQTELSPFGKLIRTRQRLSSKSSTNTFEFNLRLPGQYADSETDLYYNDHRYYDPSKGRYLTPDPMGLNAGTNSYVYARGNPLKYIDPSGLILFAFDGTENGASQGVENSLSNVRKFYLAYDQKVNGEKFYITGIGTTDEDMPVKGNIYTGDGFDERVALGFGFLDRFIDRLDSKTNSVVDIDVVGFSRGAAEARVWMNMLVSRLDNGRYTSSTERKSGCVNLRFMGLWDTVSHLGLLSENDKKYDFTVSAKVKYVAHAVALNEHRGGYGSFHGRSIFDSPTGKRSGNRIEQGFVGSHADIGGGFGTGDLSDVALMWMIEQGTTNQGDKPSIKFNSEVIKTNGWDIVRSPIVHDKSKNADTLKRPYLLFDRDFIYGYGKWVRQERAVVGGVHTEWARNLVSYYDKRCGPGHSPAVGAVKMGEYAQWLSAQGMPIRFEEPKPGMLCN